MEVLRTAAQKALEALEKPNAGLVPHNGEWMSIQSIAITALKAALAEPVQEPGCRDDGMPTSAEERHLRRLLALRAAMPHAYYDDGEAQGIEHGISIDFMREPVAHIDAKLRALNVARAIVKQSEPVQEPVAWMDIDENGNRLTVRQWSDGNREEVPLYIAPPQRKPLTDEEIEKAYQHIWRNLPDGFDFCSAGWIEQGIRYAEQAHGVTPPQISGDKEPYDPLPHSLEPEEGYEVGPSGRFIG